MEPSSDFWGSLFLGRFLVEAQTVSKLCSLGKRAGLPTPRAQPTPLPPPVELLGQPHPASSAA